MPPIGRLVAVATAIAAAFSVLRRRPEVERGAWIAAAIGASVAFLQAPAREQPPRPMAADLDATGTVARVEGVVEAGGRVDARGSTFKLAGGPEVGVIGGRSTPPPHARIAIAGRLDAAGASITAASPDALSLVAPAPAISCARLFESLRQTCREHIGAACPPRTASVLLPLLIGDTGLPEDFREDLARTGTLHIVAVSGTHLSLFLAGLRIFTRRLR